MLQSSYSSAMGMAGYKQSVQDDKDFADPTDALYDLLENGFARECLAQECIQPNQEERGWSRSYVKKVEKGSYEMRVDGKDRFLLSATLKGGKFYIYQYDSDAKENVACGHCAILTPSGPKSFKLLSTTCERCDKSLSKFNCALDHPDSFDTATDPTERKQDGFEEGRQLLASIRQSCLLEPETGTEMRCMDIDMPPIQLDETTGTKHRQCWCRRTPRQQNSAIKLRTKLPEWSNELGCLVQRFNNDRVKKASSKNFMCTTSSIEGTRRNESSQHSGEQQEKGQQQQHNVLQFGKKSKSKYVLDHRFPLVPIQAFAICLSQWEWKGDLKE
jgi:hypothetical protein